MTNLTDTQSVLLSTAAQRDSLSVYPLPKTLKPGGGLAKALRLLTSRGLIEERETTDPAGISRTEGDDRYGVFATAAGLAAINIESADGAYSVEPAVPAAPDATKPERTTKTRAVLNLLRRGEGATLAELITATSWLPHTTRAALTGLKKKGHTIDRGKRGDTTCYFVRTA